MHVFNLLISCVFFCFSGVVHAAEMKTIYLHSAESQPISVGAAVFEADGRYRINWDDSKFEDFFLSMRPFKCLEGPEKLWCRVGYPYDIKRNISSGDLTDLEYDLLFVWKNANDYGINMWNGVYYDLQTVNAGFKGELFEVDMDILAAPPEDGSLRPITPDLMEKGDPSSHWFPTLTIE